MKDLIKKLERGVFYFLAYWFSVTIIFIYGDYRINIIEILIAGVIFSIIQLFIPFMQGFFKISKKNKIAKYIFIFVLALCVNFLFKPGIFGIVYFPSEIQVGNQISSIDSIGEFVIIVIISLIFVFLTFIFDLNKK